MYKPNHIINFTFQGEEKTGTKKEAAESLEEFKKKQKIKAEFIGRTKNLNNSERSF